MKEAYFDSEFYRFVANAVSIALIIFSVSFFSAVFWLIGP